MKRTACDFVARYLVKASEVLKKALLSLVYIWNVSVLESGSQCSAVPIRICDVGCFAKGETGRTLSFYIG